MKDILELKIKMEGIEIDFSEGLKIKYNSGDVGGFIKIIYDHHQDCCESVYADFDVFKHYINDIQAMSDIEQIRIKGIEGEGFVIFFEGDFSVWGDYYDQKVGVFVPCYNSQNGYYSSQLDLLIESEVGNYKIDLTEFTCDRVA